MAGLQPWQNPRPTTNGTEIRTRTPRTFAWLRAWLPAIVWAGVIFTMSTDAFSSEHTARVFEPVLRWMIPSLTAHQFGMIHHLIRKCAHFSEYFVFGLLLYRALQGGGTGWRWAWGLWALFFAAGYSALDEFHQVFVPSRGASAYDSMLDTTGALVALVVLWAWFRLRNTQRTVEVTTSETPVS